VAEQHSYALGEGVDYTFSARLEIPDTQKLNRNKVLNRLTDHALKNADPYLPIIGGIVGEGSTQTRRGLILGLDPSKSWGTPEVDDCVAMALQISKEEDWPIESEVPPAVRVPLGRRREYDISNEEISRERVEELFRNSGRQALRLTTADLFSIRYLTALDRVVLYYEPGVFVDIDEAQLVDGALEDTLAIAEKMDQDRLVPSITGKRTQVYERRELGGES